MNGLNYRILWVDDNIETFIELGIEKEFEERLDKLGFQPDIIMFETAEKVHDHLKRDKKFDLILSDLNLVGEESGESLIRKIREGEIFTEVLFYSGQSGFDEIAKNFYQDRVSFLSLIGDEGFRGFREKVWWLIRQTISKLQELTSIRGLVMAETSELDNRLIDILSLYFKNGNEESARLREYIIKIIRDSAKGNNNKSQKLSEKDNLSILKERIFDADKKARTMGRLLELKGLHKKDPFINFYQNYKADVLDKRNMLAHARSGTIDEIEYLVLSDGNGEKIDQEQCISIRNNLRKYTDLLKSIRTALIDE